MIYVFCYQLDKTNVKVIVKIVSSFLTIFSSTAIFRWLDLTSWCNKMTKLWWVLVFSKREYSKCVFIWKKNKLNNLIDTVKYIVIHNTDRLELKDRKFQGHIYERSCSAKLNPEMFKVTCTLVTTHGVSKKDFMKNPPKLMNSEWRKSNPKYLISTPW